MITIKNKFLTKIVAVVAQKKLGSFLDVPTVEVQISRSEIVINGSIHIDSKELKRQRKEKKKRERAEKREKRRREKEKER